MTIVGFLTACVLIYALLTHHLIPLQFGVGSLKSDGTEEIAEEMLSWLLAGGPMN